MNWWRLNLPQSDSDVIKGDLNSDGVVDTFDLVFMRQSVIEGDAENFDAADINSDGSIDEEDIQLLADFLLGKTKTF